MIAKDVTVPGRYIVKVNGRLVPVTLIAVSQSGGWVGRSEVTGRKVVIHSARKLRRKL